MSFLGGSCPEDQSRGHSRNYKYQPGCITPLQSDFDWLTKLIINNVQHIDQQYYCIFFPQNVCHDSFSVKFMQSNMAFKNNSNGVETCLIVDGCVLDGWGSTAWRHYLDSNVNLVAAAFPTHTLAWRSINFLVSFRRWQWCFSWSLMGIIAPLLPKGFSEK